MRAIKYYPATSWGDAVATLAKYPLAKPLAGGSDPVRLDQGRPGCPKEPRWEILVDLRTIEGGRGLSL
ncbi:MAG: hypothetical protein KatS3mg061_1065 [Dehalococcoidia bacterium]|nr:MAG: hypothetical protein KatS3mg061_1065 [Dehalococcoidia bacterium]